VIAEPKLRTTLDRVIAAAAIDHDDFRARPALTDNGSERLPNEMPLIQCGHDDGKQRDSS
jgi:hypothetical protein